MDEARRESLLNHDKGRDEGSVGVALAGVADIREGILRFEEVLVVGGIVTKGYISYWLLAISHWLSDIQVEQALIRCSDCKAGLIGESGKEVVVVKDKVLGDVGVLGSQIDLDETTGNRDWGLSR